MDPVVLGGRLASNLVGSLIRKLFVADGPGAGLVDRPVRLKDLVSFRGEKRTLGEKDVHKLAEHLVQEAIDSPGELPFRTQERVAVANALARRLLALGDLDMSDIQAVRLGQRELARTLRHQGPKPDGLSSDAQLFLDSATEWACLQILEFFTRRSTFVARTLVEQTRTQADLIAKVDEVLARTPRPGARDTAFEHGYLNYVAKKHGKLTIYGIDLSNSPDRWPLDAAYLSLDVIGHGGEPDFGLESASPVSAPAPADQTLANHDRVLLRGVAGSGKSTLIQWLAVSAATGPADRMAYLIGRIPFVLPLRTLTRHGERLPSPAHFLTAVGCPLAGTQPEGWEHRVLTSGRGLVLVDGLDEVPEPERERTRTWLRDLLEAYPGNRWLVTSRPSAVREDWLAADGFTELGLSAMGPSDVAAFIRRWHRAAATGAPDEDAALAVYEAQLRDAVRTKPDLGRFATNPLMCGLICALHRDRRGYLPHGRKELYDSALSLLLVRRDRERDMATPELSEEPQLQLLQRLAYWLIRNGRTEMDRSRAESIIAEVLPAIPAAQVLGDADAVLRHFLIRTGLLLSPTPGTIHFVHRTFQDYLGARAAVETGDFGLLAEHAADDQWTDVIRMAVAQARPRERAELLNLLTASADKRVHLLAMACLEHATELDPAIRRRVEEATATLLPPHTDAEVKELAQIGPLILELLPGPDVLSDDEAEAVTATAALVGTEAAVPVLAQYRNHSAERVRTNLMRAWHLFDAEVYADEVLAHVDTHDLFLFLTSPAQVRTLPRLGDRTRLGITGDHDPADILGALPERVEYLGLYENTLLNDLRPFASLPSIHHMNLVSCPGVEDLRPLTEMRLTSLSIRDLGGTAGLDYLTTLQAITVMTRLPDGLTALPQDAPLASLSLGEGAITETGLRGVSTWPTLENLYIQQDIGDLAPRDWAEIARLPRLSSMSIAAKYLPGLLSAPHLPSLKTVYVTSIHEDTDLTPLSGTCPQVRTVGLYLEQNPTRLVPTLYQAFFPSAEVTVHPTRPLLF
ncbi:NACHT domain-containing protein [Streptomyces sp. NBC_00873]|uniref:NACHT domain-containing protein n=1 Tax=unclassified Streptomyces TaxID=2593676 RepID=UPI00386DAA8D|nr:NACHT domain-containing protein [Streptomyces sp. NBC_00873]WSY96919.1 NACHT domain-containing protein [Streptomyces sp. NBC_00873]WTA41308.1 NACHT domain-containing protein [Streptomyces sp. NBC_00842]WTA48589.1 NACHT domain-containing protein [Streptomyces sp. NBC_00842]